MIRPFTEEQVFQQVASLGPLENVVLIGKETDDSGGIVIWYPEIGWREIINEIDGLTHAVYRILLEAGVKRFDSWEAMREAEETERMPGWDTCDDYQRKLKAMEELTGRSANLGHQSAPAA